MKKNAHCQWCLLLALAAFMGFAPPAKAEPPIEVLLDQARIVRLPDRVATIVIGNPTVADGTLQLGGLMVVTGKGYGTTNMIALDARGEVLSEQIIVVGAAREAVLTVWRGVDRETWSCAPRCERSIMLGDAPEFFDSAVKQTEARNSQAASPSGGQAR